MNEIAKDGGSLNKGGGPISPSNKGVTLTNQRVKNNQRERNKSKERVYKVKEPALKVTVEDTTFTQNTSIVQAGVNDEFPPKREL